jgi:hypothetical protein
VRTRRGRDGGRTDDALHLAALVVVLVGLLDNQEDSIAAGQMRLQHRPLRGNTGDGTQHPTRNGGGLRGAHSHGMDNNKVVLWIAAERCTAQHRGTRLSCA